MENRQHKQDLATNLKLEDEDDDFEVFDFGGPKIQSRRDIRYANIKKDKFKVKKAKGDIHTKLEEQGYLRNDYEQQDFQIGAPEDSFEINAREHLPENSEEEDEDEYIEDLLENLNPSPVKIKNPKNRRISYLSGEADENVILQKSFLLKFFCISPEA